MKKKRIWMSGLETIIGKLTVLNCENRTLCLSGVKNIGSYEHTSGRKMTSLTLPDVEKIGDVSFYGISKLVTLSAPKLKQTGKLSFYWLSALENVSFPALTTIHGNFLFKASSSKIANLNGFSVLTSVESVDIQDAGALAAFSGLEGWIPTLLVSEWRVKGIRDTRT